jgi:deaminated glutathione amidase
MHKIAVIQMCSCLSVGVNLVTAKRLVVEAANQGAKIAILPDHFALFSKKSNDYAINKEILGEGRIQNFVQKLAQEYNIWIIASGIPLVSEYSDQKFYLATVVYNNRSQLVDVYYHLRPFLPLVYERASIKLEFQEYGGQVKIIKTPYGCMGLVSTYDLYSPEVFRYLRIQGADFFAVSSAMNSEIGVTSWRLMLKARALENNAAIFAANQSGFHEDMGLLTHGHSMILDDSAKVSACGEIGEKVLISAIDSASFKITHFDKHPFQLRYRR